MPLGMEVGLSPGDFALDGNPAPSPKRGWSPQIFGPYLLWPNGWMDQDGAGIEVGLSPGDFVLDVDTPLPNFRPISIAVKRLDASRCHLVWR